MKKAMLSQPMAGKTNEEIAETRERAIKALEEKGFQIVNTLFTDAWYSKEEMTKRGVEQIPLCFLAKSLENMSLCHAAYFCKGWEKARGCKVEHDAAVAYGLEVIYEEEADKATEALGKPCMENLSFGQALVYLKNGLKLARRGWNGKGMWIVLMPALYLPPYNTADTTRKVNDRTAKHIGEDKPLDSQPYIAMWTAQEKWQPGWLASQADMMAEDWMVVGEELPPF